MRTAFHFTQAIFPWVPLFGDQKIGGFGPKVSDFDFLHSTDTSRFDCGPCASTARSTDFGRCSRALGFFWVPRATQVSRVVAVFAPCTYPDYCSSASLLQLVSNRRCRCYLCVHVAYVRYPYLQPHRPSRSPQHHTTFWLCMCSLIDMFRGACACRCVWSMHPHGSGIFAFLRAILTSSVFFFQIRTFRVWLAHAQHIRVVSGPLTLLCASSRWVWPFPAVMGVSDDYQCIYYYLRIVRNALPARVRGGSACLGSPSSFSGTTLYWHQVGLAILSARHVLTHSCVFLAIFMWSEMLCRCLCMFGVLTWLLD